jgi:hypothetical protein
VVVITPRKLSTDASGAVLPSDGGWAETAVRIPRFAYWHRLFERRAMRYAASLGRMGADR